MFMLLLGNPNITDAEKHANPTFNLPDSKRRGWKCPKSPHREAIMETTTDIHHSTAVSTHTHIHTAQEVYNVKNRIH